MISYLSWVNLLFSNCDCRNLANPKESDAHRDQQPVQPGEVLDDAHHVPGDLAPHQRLQPLTPRPRPRPGPRQAVRGDRHLRPLPQVS